jgi:hypothetical protein
LEEQVDSVVIIRRKTAPGDDAKRQNCWSNGFIDLARRCVVWKNERKLEEEELSSELNEGEEVTPTELKSQHTHAVEKCHRSVTNIFSLD